MPPPTQIAATCPRAVKVADPLPIAVENSFATEPARLIPENPEPSSPVMEPTIVEVAAATALFSGTALASAIPRSFTRPLDPAGNTSPKI